MKIGDRDQDAVIPGTSKASQPGIQKRIWIPCLRQEAHPGMTVAAVDILERADGVGTAPTIASLERKKRNVL